MSTQWTPAQLLKHLNMAPTSGALHAAETALSAIISAALPDGCVEVCKLCGCRAKEEEIYGCQYKSRLGAFSHHPDCPIRQESKA